MNDKIRKFLLNNIEKDKLPVFEIYADYLLNSKSVTDMKKEYIHSIYKIDKYLKLKNKSVYMLHNLLSNYIIPDKNNKEFEFILYRLIKSLYYITEDSSNRGRPKSIPYKKKIINIVNDLFQYGLRTKEIIQLAGFTFLTKSKPVSIYGTFNEIDETVIFDYDTFNYLSKVKNIRLDIIKNGFKFAYISNNKRDIPYFYIRKHETINRYIIPLILFIIYFTDYKKSYDKSLINYFIEGMVLRVILSTFKINKYFKIEFFRERIDNIINKNLINKQLEFINDIEIYNIIDFIYEKFIKYEDELKDILKKRKQEAF